MRQRSGRRSLQCQDGFAELFAISEIKAFHHFRLDLLRSLLLDTASQHESTRCSIYLLVLRRHANWYYNDYWRFADARDLVADMSNRI
ncbi:hypothetical protein L484_010732 [Morus notabilis]|uniref:Uncharacterized protein n=1 Tax=Morus notabilis TaxID=981085 RepID=W9RI31_9ROSA|nr:hypothetical protein L484_010732 [Morus notabilis]